MADYYDADGNELYEDELRAQFDAWLDESHDNFIIGAFTFYPSGILRMGDPIAYQFAFSEWIDSNIEEGFLLTEPPVNMCVTTEDEGDGE